MKDMKIEHNYFKNVYVFGYLSIKNLFDLMNYVGKIIYIEKEFKNESSWCLRDVCIIENQIFVLLQVYNEDSVMIKIEEFFKLKPYKKE